MIVMRYEHKKAHAFLMRFLSRQNVDICNNEVTFGAEKVFD